MWLRVGLYQQLIFKENNRLKKAECRRIDGFELWCWRSLESLLDSKGDQSSRSLRKSTLNIHWMDWCWSWSSNTLATWCKELTHWKRPWCWEGLKAGGEGDYRGWDGWMVSLTQWTWVWANSGDSEGQGSLVCCSLCGRTVLDTT